MDEMYKNLLEELDSSIEIDDEEILVKKIESMEPIRSQTENPNKTKYLGNVYWNLECIKLIRFYNEKRMKPIKSHENMEYDSLDSYNYKDSNYKGVSRDIKNRLIEYHFCYNDGDYYFEDNDKRWKTRLFDMLGIKFSICYINDKENKRSFNSFKKTFVCNGIEEKKVRKLFSMICKTEGEDFGNFCTARYRIEIKNVIKEKAERICEKYPFAKVIGFDKDENCKECIIDMPIFIDTVRLKENKRAYIKYIYENLEKKYTFENEKVHIYVYGYNNRKKIRSRDILKLGLEKGGVRYRLSTKIPNTDYSPVYYALFHNINKNVFFSDPTSCNKKNGRKLRIFYKNYYESLNKKLNKELSEELNEELKCEKYKENYWLSEKLFGVNFLNILLKKINEFQESDKYKDIALFGKEWEKNEITPLLVNLINILILIDEPELRILYLDLFIDPEISPQTSIEYMERINLNGFDDIIRNDNTKETIESEDKIEREIEELLERIEKKGKGKKLEKFKRIQEEPDLQFLDEKEYQAGLNFICKNTVLFYKFMYTDVTYEEPQGIFVEEKVY